MGYRHGLHSEKVLRAALRPLAASGLLSYDSTDVLRFFGTFRTHYQKGPLQVETSFYDRFDGKRIKHWLDKNSLKLYSHYNVLRTEMTINNPTKIKVLRRCCKMIPSGWRCALDTPWRRRPAAPCRGRPTSQRTLLSRGRVG